MRRLICLVRGHLLTDVEIETDHAEGVPGRTFAGGHCVTCHRRITYVEQVGA